VRIAYASGEVAHARLQGRGAELDAGLAARALQMPPTFMRQRAMATLRCARLAVIRGRARARVASAGRLPRLRRLPDSFGLHSHQ
jgi:hypothetical protein